MQFGEHGELLSETGPWPASVGDSCANSARMVHLRVLLGEEIKESDKKMLSIFRTPHGYVRHPLAPADWAEIDFSSDQALPLYIAYKTTGMDYYANEMKVRIRDAKWKTGNGDYISPAFYAVLNDHPRMLKMAIRAQELLFKLPYRWSDSTHWFEHMEQSSADFLNFAHLVMYAKIPFGIDKKLVIDKISHYYSNEADSSWLVHMYEQAINKE